MGKTKPIPFFGFFRTTPENVSKDTIVILGSLCVSKSVHPILGQKKSTTILRRLSHEFCTHNLHAKILLENYDIVDLGDFCGSELTYVVTEVIRRGAKVLVIGGDHTTTFYALRGISEKDLVIFDAHLDSEKCNKIFHHGCVTRKLLETKNGMSIVLMGVRGYSTLQQEIEFIRRQGQRILFWPISKESIEYFLRRSSLVSIDLDFFNPKSFWAVRAPEPFGFNIDEFIKIVNKVEKINAKYIDIVEYAPDADPGYICGKVLLQLVLEILALLVRS